jgi:hypothetical protein
MLVRAKVGCAFTIWRGTLSHGRGMFTIERSHACSMRDCPASWSPPSGGLVASALHDALSLIAAVDLTLISCLRPREKPRVVSLR